MDFKLPIAWLQLIRQRLRMLTALAGITFIIVLMFIQIGFRNALYSSATQVHRSLRGDLFILSAQYKSLTSNQSFSRSRLYQVGGLPDVESITPLYTQFAKLKNPVNGQKYSIYVIGFEPVTSVFEIDAVEASLEKLKLPDVVLFDENSRPEFGPIADWYHAGDRVPTFEVYAFVAPLGYKVRVGGLFNLGPSFGVDGNLITSTSTFLRIFQPVGRSSDLIDIGVIRLKETANHRQVAQQIREMLAKDVQVFTRDEFIRLEKDYWAQRTPIGFTMNLMLTMGSIIAIIIVYQILYSNVSNHLKAFATLKAIGYTDSYLLGVVFRQALILAFLGYIPGLLIALWLYSLARKATNLPMILSTEQGLLMLTSTILVCTLSGLLTANKLRLVDPTDVF